MCVNIAGNSDCSSQAMHHCDHHHYYIRQVNGVKLADIYCSLMSVCLSVCLCALSPIFNSVCPSRNASAISLMQPIFLRKPILADICTL